MPQSRAVNGSQGLSKRPGCGRVALAALKGGERLLFVQTEESQSLHLSSRKRLWI